MSVVASFLADRLCRMNRQGALLCELSQSTSTDSVIELFAERVHAVDYACSCAAVNLSWRQVVLRWRHWKSTRHLDEVFGSRFS